MKDFSFDYESIIQPRELIEDFFIPVIKEKTKSYLFAEIKDYKGKIRSYEEKRTISAAELLGRTHDCKEFHDIQDSLGELGKELLTYELFVGSKLLSSYKYRILFVQYGKAGYPATVVLTDAISREINFTGSIEMPYIYKIGSMQRMKDLLNAILGAESLHSVMQEAINASIVEEQRIRKQQDEKPEIE